VALGQRQLQDAPARAVVRRRHEQRAIQAAGALQRVVHVPRRVGGGQDQEVAVVGSDRVELLQELVHERPAGAAGLLAARVRERVELVEEQHAGGAEPRLLEGLVEVALAEAQVRIQHVLDPHVEEREPTLAGGRAGEQGLAAAGRAVEHHAAARAAPVLQVEVGSLERQDDRAVDRLLGVVEAADVGEGHLRLGVEVVRGREGLVCVHARLGRRRLRAAAQLALEVGLQGGHAVDHPVVLGPLQHPGRELEVAGLERRGAGVDDAVLRQRAALEQELVVIERLGAASGTGERVGEQQAQLVVVGRQLERAAQRLDLVGAHRLARLSSQRAAAGAAVQL
jgi:hypothetical protein